MSLLSFLYKIWFHLFHLLFSLQTEAFWIAIGSIVTACALVYTLTQGRRDKKHSIQTVKTSLNFEILANIDSLFSAEIERESLFDVMASVRKNYIEYIKDQNALAKIQKLYSELSYYQKILQQFWLGERVMRNGSVVVQKQISTMNKFLEYFGCEQLDAGKIGPERDKGIKIKVENMDSWRLMLKRQIDDMFS